MCSKKSSPDLVINTLDWKNIIVENRLSYENEVERILMELYPKGKVHHLVGHYGDEDNNFNSVIEFENNCVGVLTCYRTSGMRYERFEIHGKNIATYIRPSQYAEIYEGNQCILLEESKITTFHHAFGYFDEIDYFIEGIKQDKKIKENNIFEALETMRLVYAIREFQNKDLNEILKIGVDFSQ